MTNENDQLTFKNAGFTTEDRIAHALLANANTEIQVKRTAYFTAHLTAHLVSKGVISEEELDNLLVSSIG